MHEFGRFIQSLMDHEQMTRPDLERRAGLTRSHIHSLLTAETLSRLPEVKTFEALHQAFPSVPISELVLSAAAAAGLDVGDRAQVDYRELSNEALLGILKDRLERGSDDGWLPGAEKRPRHRGRRRLRADEIKPEPGLVLPHDLAAMEHRAD